MRNYGWIFFTLGLAFATSAFAKEESMEITSAIGTGSGAGVLGQNGPLGGVTIISGSSSTVTTVGLGGGIGFIASPTLEIMINPSLTLVSTSGQNVSIFGLTAGPVFNFIEPIENSPFIYVGPGLSLVSFGGNSTTGFQFVVAAGKRFQLGDRISYSPQVSFSGFTSGGFTSAIGITPIQFSLFL